MLVPIKEMIDSINVSKKQLDIVPGGWARVRRGKYAGDLAQIIDIADSQDVVRVRLVPRLDLEEDRDEYDKKRKKGTYKPPQKLFNPERLNSRALTSSLQKKGGYWYLGSDMFKDGYLEKDMKVTGLVSCNICWRLVPDKITLHQCTISYHVVDFGRYQPNSWRSYQVRFWRRRRRERARSVHFDQ